MMITVPETVVWIIQKLEQCGWQAYAVGGCVRDSLLGRQPEDWDICTSAQPQETERCFAGCPVIKTGVQHGTVTVLIEGKPYEITTFRIDGAYLDHRRPDSVQFIRELKQDLMRRDFTINAMAFHPQKGLIDYFHGKEDLKAGMIRCVGDPLQRFSEDGLRILRALRFAAVYGFQIEKDTAQAAHEKRELLKHIAAERIQAELCRLLLGDSVEEMLLEFHDVLSVFIPQIAQTVGFEQHNPHHNLDIWGHTAESVSQAPKEQTLRLCMLLHDIGKPACYSCDEAGVGHFRGHAAISAEAAADVLRRLRFDRRTIHDVTELIHYHDAELGCAEKAVRRWLFRLGETQLCRLLEVKRADALAQSPEFRFEKLNFLNDYKSMAEKILLSGQCLSLKQLAVDGRDLIAAGIREGWQIGAALNWCLEQVLEETLPNEKEALLAAVKKIELRQNLS